MGIIYFAETFAAHGFAGLLFEYRYFGERGGEPREKLDPLAQIEDYRNALTYLSLRDEIDELCGRSLRVL